MLVFTSDYCLITTPHTTYRMLHGILIPISLTLAVCHAGVVGGGVGGGMVGSGIIVGGTGKGEKEGNSAGSDRGVVGSGIGGGLVGRRSLGGVKDVNIGDTDYKIVGKTLLNKAIAASNGQYDLSVCNNRPHCLIYNCDNIVTSPQLWNHFRTLK